MTRRWLLRVVLTLMTSALSSSVWAQAVEDPPTGDITGTLTFLGCTPPVRAFDIYAVPMVGESDDRSTRTDAVATAEVVHGQLSNTGDPHTFDVRLPAVQFGVAYQLRIVSSSPNPCGRVFWEGPEQGIAYAGIPVRLFGYAPRSKVEVLGLQPAGTPRRGWVGFETVDLQNLGTATRQFRWYTDIPGVTAGLVQVSTEQFPKQDVPNQSCASPPGVVFQRTFAAQSGVWTVLPQINLALVAAQVALSGPAGLRDYNLFTFGAPLYVRVVPVTGRIFRCSALEHGPAPWVVLANAAKAGGTRISFGVDPPGPPPPAPITLTPQSGYTPPWFWDHPKSGETAYRVVRPHKIPDDIFTGFPQSVALDPFAYQFAKFTSLDPGDTIPVGFRFWFKPGSSGFSLGDVFEGAVSIVTGVVDAVGLVVDQVSKAYESIKKHVAKVVTSAISATGLVNCEASSACRAVVETAIKTGLAATGLPPSLPNWDAVVDQGFEYFAAEVVSQAGVGNVPGAQDLTEAAAKALVEEAATQIKKNRGGGGDIPAWLTVDLGQEPAILTLELTTYGQKPTLFPNFLRVSDNPALLGGGVDLPSDWRVTNTLDRFIKFPLVLRPNLAGFTPPTDVFGHKVSDYAAGLAAKAWWKSRLASLACVQSSNQFLVKTGPLLLSSTYTLTSLSFDPQAAVSFPPYLSCVP